MGNDRKWLVWPDTHFPIHDKRKVGVMLKIVKDWKPDRLTFLGDLDDMQAPSRFASGTPEEWTNRVSVTTELYTKKFLQEIREMLPDADIDYFEGNHEARLTSYIAKKAKALDGLVTMPKILDLDNLGIKWYEYAKPAQHVEAGYYVHHGSKISATGAGKKEMESYQVSGWSGHTHKTASYSMTSLGTGQLNWFECGHLTDISAMDYTQVHDWQHGFGYAHISAGKVFGHVARFDGNVVFLDGVKYK